VGNSIGYFIYYVVIASCTVQSVTAHYLASITLWLLLTAKRGAA